MSFDGRITGKRSNIAIQPGKRLVNANGQTETNAETGTRPGGIGSSTRGL